MNKPWLDKRLPLRYDSCIMYLMLLLLDITPNNWNAIRGLMIVINVVMLMRVLIHTD